MTELRPLPYPNEPTVHIDEWFAFIALERALEDMRWCDDGGPAEPPEGLTFVSLLLPWTPVERSHSDARYDSVSEFMDDVNGPAKIRENHALKECWAHRMGKSALDRPDRDLTDFYGGCRTGDDVQRIVKNGWPEGLDRARQLMEGFDLSDIITADRRRRMTRGDFGDHLDIGSVYAGRHMTAWTRGYRKRILSPTKVDLLINMIVTKDEPADHLFWRGAAGVILADLLEQSGLPTRLVCGFGGKATDSEVIRKKRPHLMGSRRVMMIDYSEEKAHQSVLTSCRILVKDYGAPVDISTCSSVLHPGFARAMGIGWSLLVSPFKYNYHYILYVGECIKDEGEYIASHGVQDEETARRWMKETLDKIDGEKDEDA